MAIDRPIDVPAALPKQNPALFSEAYNMNQSAKGLPQSLKQDFQQNYYDWCVNSLGNNWEDCCRSAGGTPHGNVCA